MLDVFSSVFAGLPSMPLFLEFMAIGVLCSVVGLVQMLFRRN